MQRGSAPWRLKVSIQGLEFTAVSHQVCIRRPLGLQWKAEGSMQKDWCVCDGGLKIQDESLSLHKRDELWAHSKNWSSSTEEKQAPPSSFPLCTVRWWATLDVELLSHFSYASKHLQLTQSTIAKCIIYFMIGEAIIIRIIY